MGERGREGVWCTTGRGPDESILVYARDFDAILKFGDYLENKLPDNPKCETLV